MDQLKNYVYKQSEPLSKPQNEKGVFNAFYKALKVGSNTEVLLS